MVFYAASFGFQFLAEHVSGAINTAADAISCKNIQLFLSLVPQMPRVSIPQLVLDLLVTRRPTWGSWGLISIWATLMMIFCAQCQPCWHTWLYVPLAQAHYTTSTMAGHCPEHA